MIATTSKSLVNSYLVGQRELLLDLKTVFNELNCNDDNLVELIASLKNENLYSFYNPIFLKQLSKSINSFFKENNLSFDYNSSQFKEEIKEIQLENIVLDNGFILLIRDNKYSPKFLNEYKWKQQVTETQIQNINIGIDLLKSDSKIFENIEHLLKFIVPLESMQSDLYNSWSINSELGVIYMTIDSPPHIIAETLIHECDHQKLFIYEHIFGNLHNNNKDCIYISPWRDDLRPIDGLVKGASAFSAVAHGLIKLVLKNQNYPKDQILERIVQSTLEVSKCINDITKFAELTKVGADFLKELKKENAYCLEFIDQKEILPLKNKYDSIIKKHYDNFK